MNKYAACVLGAGFLWGFLGFFTRHMAMYGIGSAGAIMIRCSIAAVCFGIYILCTGAAQFKVRLRDIWCFIGSGLLSLLFFTYCYITAMSMMSMSLAAILLYTAPAIVMVLSAILFREKISGLKVLALVLAFAGCCLISVNAGKMSITLKGFLFGLGSGLGYALYTIFSRFALNRGYTSSTINFYSCVLAAAGSAVIWGARDAFACAVSSAPAAMWCIGIGALCCFVPYLLYTYGLSGVENGRASVLASIEPVVASVVGIAAFGERMTFMILVSVVLILSAVVTINIKA